MFRYIALTMIILPLFFGAVGLVYGIDWPPLAGVSGQSSGSERVSLYSGGERRRISETDPCYNSIIENVTTLLSSANDTHRLLVTTGLIEKLKKGEKGVEIVFVKPKTLRIGQTDQTLYVSEVFIPLTGKFAADYTTIFYADPDYKDTNQCINSIDKELRKKIENCL